MIIIIVFITNEKKEQVQNCFKSKLKSHILNSEIRHTHTHTRTHKMHSHSHTQTQQRESIGYARSGRDRVNIEKLNGIRRIRRDMRHYLKMRVCEA